MKIMKSAALALALCMPAMGAQAQEQIPLFASYDEMRQIMDGLIRDRNTQELMLRFGGGDEMTPQQLDSLDAQVDALYPQPLDNVAVLRRVQLENGFAQELLAYWTGYNYLYAYVFMQDRGNEIVSINFRFNSDFVTLNSLL